MPNTTNFNWVTPADTDLVKDGAAAIRTLGNNIDASLVDLKGGTTGQVLAKATNTDLDFTWVAQDDSNAIQNAIVDAKGDLITATAADVPARLGVGANGTVLTADSAEATGLKWAIPASGGMTQLATGTLSGSQIDLTSISGSYNDLVLIVRNYRPNTDGQSLRMRFNADSGTSYTSNAMNSAEISDAAPTSTVLTLTGSVDSTTNNGIVYVKIFDYANSGTWKMAENFALTSGDGTVTNFSNRKAHLLSNISAAITQINLFPASGTFNGGTYILYGVK